MTAIGPNCASRPTGRASAPKRAILTALGDRIAREESELYPVAETLFKAEAPPPRERGRRTV